eukprot:m.178189 g.178189  ORF g.178189 m.178189 type:complete len:51 (+) comp39171_c0_seq15:4-156(+)
MMRMEINSLKARIGYRTKRGGGVRTVLEGRTLEFKANWKQEDPAKAITPE